MTTRTHKTVKPKGKSRLRAEIVEGARALHELGAYSDSDLEVTTIRMLGRSALPRVEQLSPKEIVALRKQVGVSQAVLAGYLNIAVKTLSQWERGTRRPVGAALKLLHVVRDRGLDAVR